MKSLNFNPKVPLVYSRIFKDNQPRNQLSGEENSFFASLGIEPLNVINQYVLQSGRISGKTTIAREYCMFRLMTVNGANIVVTRAESNDIRLTVFSGFVKLINEITNNHPDEYFNIRYSPFEITFKPNGNKIYFIAINGDINRTKGLEIPKGYIDVVWHEECNECDKADFIEAADLTFLRFFKKCSKTLYAFNTEQLRSHWSNSFFKDKINRNLAIKVYGTWKDIAKYLDGSTIRKILDDRNKDIKYYRYWYLGHLVSLNGLVFPQFNRKKHVITELEEDKIYYSLTSIIICIDAANKNDATSANLLGVMADGRIIILHSFYYDPKGREGQSGYGQKDDIEIARLICDWSIKWKSKFLRIESLPTYGIVDNANWNLMQMLAGTFELGYVNWMPATNKNILRDTKRLQNLFATDAILFYLCSGSDIQCGINEIEAYMYDEKTNDIAKGQSDHFIDALKYGTFAYMYPQIYNINR